MIDEMFCSERDLGQVLEEVAVLGVRLIMQTAIEAEFTQGWAAQSDANQFLHADGPTASSIGRKRKKRALPL
jgi:hypothetical protein